MGGVRERETMRETRQEDLRDGRRAGRDTGKRGRRPVNGIARVLGRVTGSQDRTEADTSVVGRRRGRATALGLARCGNMHHQRVFQYRMAHDEALDMMQTAGD